MGMNVNVSECIDFASDDILQNNIVPTGKVSLSQREFEIANPALVNYVNSTDSLLILALVDLSIIKRLKNIPNFEDNLLAALNNLVGSDMVNHEVISEEGLPHEKYFIIKLTCKNQEYIGKGTLAISLL